MPHFTKRLPAFCLVALTLASAAACHEGTGPNDLPLQMTLVSYDDAPLPVTAQTTYRPSLSPGAPDVLCDLRVVAGRLYFDTDGRYIATFDNVVVCPDGRPEVASTGSEHGTYGVDGENVSLNVTDLPEGAVQFWLATRSGTELLVYQRWSQRSGWGDGFINSSRLLYRAGR